MSLVDSIIKVAQSYIGVREGSQDHQDIIDAYNSVRYADAYKMTMSDPWCCAFVVACFALCNAGDIIPGYAACNQMISVFKSLGRWKNKWSTVHRGDIIFYDWEGDNSSDHVGIVVQNMQGKLSIIEGNKSDTVGYRELYIGDSCIMGYGEPNYDGSDGNGSSVESTKPPIGKVDKEYIRLMPLLQMKCEGVYVKIVQCLLSYIANYWDEWKSNPIDVDGEFGPVTRSLVASYQMWRGLEVDGIVGTETWTDLLIYFDYTRV